MLKIPKSERSEHRFLKNGIPVYLITSKNKRAVFYLYKISGNNLIKIASSNNPLKLERHM